MNARPIVTQEMHDHYPDMADSFEKLLAHLDTLPKRDARRICEDLYNIALWMIFTHERKLDRPQRRTWTRYLYSLIVGCCSLSYYRLVRSEKH